MNDAVVVGRLYGGAIASTSSAACFADHGRSSSQLARLPPVTNSCTMYGRPSCSPTSSTWTTPACGSWAAAFASALEALQHVRVGELGGEDHFQGNNAVQAFGAGLINDAHAAAAKFFQDLVTRNVDGGRRQDRRSGRDRRDLIRGEDRRGDGFVFRRLPLYRRRRWGDGLGFGRDRLRRRRGRSQDLCGVGETGRAGRSPEGPDGRSATAFRERRGIGKGGFDAPDSVEIAHHRLDGTAPDAPPPVGVEGRGFVGHRQELFGAATVRERGAAQDLTPLPHGRGSTKQHQQLPRRLRSAAPAGGINDPVSALAPPTYATRGRLSRRTPPSPPGRPRRGR